eukprot:Phypoly_transcript_05126.p2 GENE.Phypoly_transcript_05126~~Phypoly_transcript_05126.p2  ORF type:complete len:237 (+),score=80.93 Phypoly_transcript_05126:65-775(+)
MASAKKAAGNGVPAMPKPGGSKKTPAKPAPAANGATTPSKRGKVIPVRSTPVLYPERELPPVPEYTNKELTNARNTHDMKIRIKLDYNVTLHKTTREIQRYRDRFETGKNEVPLDKYLEESIAKNLFPAELVKKTVTRKRKRKTSEGDALSALNKLSETGEVAEGEEGEEGEGEEGEEGEGGKGKGKEKKKEDEEGEEEEEGSEDSDGGEYNLGEEKDDDDDRMDDEDGGGGDDLE